MAAILIVDDLADNRRFLVTLLGHHGHRLVEAANGRAGLTAVRAEPFDLVITDVLMPVMDGFEFVRQLRLDPKTRATPVVFYSATFSELEARALARDLGVSDVLTKPADSVDVLKVVGRVLSGDPERALPLARSQVVTAFERGHLRLLSDNPSHETTEQVPSEARLRALINIGLDLASGCDTDRRLQRVCEAARDLFSATYVTLGVVDVDTRTVVKLVTSGTDDAAWAKVGDPVPGILATVIGEQRSLRGQNPGGHPAALGLPSGHPDVQAFLAVPLASAGHTHGWMCLVGNEGSVFTEDDEQLVRALSAQVGALYELEHEMLQRKQSAEALRTAEERMRFALEAAEVGIWDLDYTTGVLRWSETIERHYGVHPGSFGGTFEAFVERVHPADRESVIETIAEAVSSGSDFKTANRSIWPDGTVHWLCGAGRILLDANGVPIRGVGISIDDTQRRTLEAQLRQAQKMETVGRLAGGVAHDFNNLLSVILGYCTLITDDLAADDPHRADVAEIHAAGERAAGLTRQLLAFSRKQILEPTLLDLSTVVGDMRSMLGRLIAEDVKVVLNLGSDLALVRADRGQVEQVVMNLAVNARDAMPDGGTLTIETGCVEFGKPCTTLQFGGKPDSYVRLTMTDTGTGMTPEVQARLFEPFFTTKGPGKGTGLGMATVYGIVTQSGGTIGVETEVGKGTSFKVDFPNVAAVDGTVPAADPTTGLLTGTETVLLVEDEAGLGQLARKLLERQGYTVVLAADAVEALRLFHENPAIDIVVTDVVMPGMSGPELTKRLVQERPSLKVMYVSGYAEDSIVHHGILQAGIAFLGKPFTSETLGRKVREVLDGSETVFGRPKLNGRFR